MQSLKGLSKKLIATDKDIGIATSPVRMHSHKYSRGRVLIIAASTEWRGAAVMAAYAANNAIAALRTVSGFVTVAATSESILALSGFSPVFVLRELKGSEDDYVREIDSIRHDSLVMGPGVQNMKMPLFRKLARSAESVNKPLVIDADALGMISKDKKQITSNMALTPHDGEFKKLAGVDLEGKGIGARIEAASSFAKKYGCVLVLKGHETIIADRARLKVNAAKTPALATMGSGDVLAGMLASYAAQHRDLFESAVAAVHAHSLIGDTLFKKKGMHIIATDVIDAIPDALKRFDVIR